MRFLVLILILMASQAFAQTFDPTAYNGSACTGVGTPHAGCTAAFSPINTKASNVGAITVTTDPFPINTNISDLHTLLYPGANPKILFHYMDWWGCSGHMNIGKTSGNAANIAKEASTMLAYGGYGMVIDWAGNRDSAKSCRLNNTNAWATYLTANFGSVPLRMGIMVDEGSLTAACPIGSTPSETCLTTELNAELDYVNTNYASQSWYLKDGTNPLVFYFIDETDWSGTNWTTVWANVKAHTNAFSAPFKFIFQNTFTHTQTDGGFAWMGNPVAYSASSQLFWGSSNSTTPTSYNNFYAGCIANPTQRCVGMGKKGFDDGIGFGGGFTGVNRVQSQRCGQTWLDTFSLIGADGFSSSNQLAYLQIGTWNDYEEGTEVETGIDNCWRVGTASITGGTLNWNLSKTDSTYAVTSTIDKLQVLYGNGSSFQVGIDNISSSATSQSLASIPDGTWTIYLRVLGKPAMQNQLSLALPFSSHINRVVGHTIGGGRVVH